MDRYEFIDTLRKNITVLGDYNYVNDTVKYYENYIYNELSHGYSEEEVLNELGDPRLIAKSIIASYNSETTRSEDDTPVDSDRYTGLVAVANKTIVWYKGLPIMVRRIIRIALLVGAIVVGSKLLVAAAPLILIAVVIGIFYSFYKGR
jgi:uncharacterized membrane protein